MNYYERHIGDYSRDAGHLSLLEHGVYTRLMDSYYSREAPIPQDQSYRLAGARTAAEKAAVDSVLREFFTLTDGQWRQKRCDAVIDKRHQFLRSQKEKAGKRWQSQQHPTAMPRHALGIDSAYPGGIPPISHSPSPISHSQDSRSSQVPDVCTPSKGGDYAHDAKTVSDAIKAEYPQGTYGGQNWILAERVIGRLLDEGGIAEELIASARLYAEQQRAKGSIGTQFIRSPEKFFGEGYWRGPFPLPIAKPLPSLADRITWRPTE